MVCETCSIHCKKNGLQGALNSLIFSNSSSSASQKLLRPQDAVHASAQFILACLPQRAFLFLVKKIIKFYKNCFFNCVFHAKQNKNIMQNREYICFGQRIHGFIFAVCSFAGETKPECQFLCKMRLESWNCSPKGVQP